jgi:hypothetical protein
MLILIESAEPLGDATLKKLKRKIELGSHTPNSVEVLKGAQSGIWGLFSDMVTVSWTYAETHEEYVKQAKKDANQLAAQLPGLVTSLGLPKDTQVRYTLHDGALVKGKPMASQWRSLFAQAVLKLEHPQVDDIKL